MAYIRRWRKYHAVVASLAQSSDEEVLPYQNSSTNYDGNAPSVYRPPFYRQNSRLSRFPPLKIPRYTAKLSYRHPPVFQG